MENFNEMEAIVSDKKEIATENDTYFQMPTGIYYEKSEWGKEVEEKSERFKDAYDQVLKQINTAVEQQIIMYIDKNPGKVQWKEGVDHNFFEQGGIEVVDTKEEHLLRLTADMGKMSLSLREENGTYRASVESLAGYLLLPDEIVTDIRSVLQSMLPEIENTFNRV